MSSDEKPATIPSPDPEGRGAEPQDPQAGAPPARPRDAAQASEPDDHIARWTLPLSPANMRAGCRPSGGWRCLGSSRLYRRGDARSR